MDLQTVESFFDASWSVYDLILDQNYMYHREIYTEVLSQLRTFEVGQYTLLDLGCGSAKCLATVLVQHPPLQYVGVDLSAIALAEARQLLRPHGFAVELQQGDLLEAIQQTPPQSFDIIFAGFAIHHLLEADKQAFFQYVYYALKPKGFLLMPDTVRHEDETREVYLQRYVQNLKTTWTALSTQQTADVVEHILGQDYPEKPSALIHIAQQTNFLSSEELNRFGHHATWRFST